MCSSIRQVFADDVTFIGVAVVQPTLTEKNARTSLTRVATTTSASTVDSAVWTPTVT